MGQEEPKGAKGSRISSVHGPWSTPGPGRRAACLQAAWGTWCHIGRVHSGRNEDKDRGIWGLIHHWIWWRGGNGEGKGVK